MGVQKRIVRFWKGGECTKECAQFGLALEGSESGIGLVCARSL